MHVCLFKVMEFIMSIRHSRNEEFFTDTHSLEVGLHQGGVQLLDVVLRRKSPSQGDNDVEWGL